MLNDSLRVLLKNWDVQAQAERGGSTDGRRNRHFAFLIKMSLCSFPAVKLSAQRQCVDFFVSFFFSSVF